MIIYFSKNLEVIISRKLGTIFIHEIVFGKLSPDLCFGNGIFWLKKWFSKTIITAKRRANCRLRFFKSRLGTLTSVVSHLIPRIVLYRRLYFLSTCDLMFNFSTLGLTNICIIIRFKEFSLETIIINICIFSAVFLTPLDTWLGCSVKPFLHFNLVGKSVEVCTTKVQISAFFSSARVV